MTLPLSLTWAGPGSNQVPANQTTQQLQSANLILAWINLHLTAGWTCAGSSCGGVATVNSAGGSKSISIVGSVCTLTDTTAPFTADMVGRSLTISGATNSGNNTTKTITAGTTTTVTFTNASGVAETSTLTWAVAASAAMDGLNRLTNATNDFVWAASGTAHGWIVLAAPTNYPSSTGTVYKLIELSNTTGNLVYQVNITRASASFTGGSTTVPPTATTSTFLAYSSIEFVKTTLNNVRYHAYYSSGGDIFFGISTNGTGYCAFVDFEVRTTGFEAGYPYPYMGFSKYTDTGTGAATMASIGSPNNAATFGRTGLYANALAGGYTLYNAASANLALNGYTSAGSPYTGNYPGFPMIVMAGAGQCLGTVIDIFLAPTGTGILQATEEPSGTTQMAIIGEIWVPDLGIKPVF